MKILNIIIILFLLLLISLFMYLLYSRYTENYSNNHNKKIKILNLVLYSKNESYNKMYDITRKYYLKFYPQVKTIYYLFDESINKPTFKDDILLIPGKETYLPGILDKTIKAIEITKNMDYDYLLRSNISTVVNIKLLLNYLTKNPNIDYGGSWEMTHIRKGFRDPLNGINDDRYDGLNFISGTGIIMSRKAVYTLLEHKNKIDYSIVDDVSIGNFFRNNTNIKPNEFKSAKSYDDKDLRKESSGIDLNIIFHRNRSSNRENDVKNIKVITDVLSN
jgi:hypothetical protein